MIKLSKGQVYVLTATSLPMAAAGIGGGIASYLNFASVLAERSYAASLVLAGEGATVICAMVALAVTLMGQHTPAPARAGLWLIPMVASVAGAIIAPDLNTKIIMGLSPMAMTAAGEGIALVARRVVAYRTRVDIEQQRRSGLLLWHANRAVNGKGLGRWLSERAVWRLSKQFAATDGQLSVQLGETQRYRINEGADANLAAVLSGGTGKRAERPSLSLAPSASALPPATPSEAVNEAHSSDESDEDPGLSQWMNGIMDEYKARHPEIVPAPAPDLMSADDVAEALNVKPGTIRTWVARGKLKVADKDSHGRNLFRPEDVEAL